MIKNKFTKNNHKSKVENKIGVNIKDTIEKKIKISDLNAKKENEINRLGYQNRYLIPCDSKIDNEEVIFIYNLIGLSSLKCIQNNRIVEKLRFLINVSDTFSLFDEYVFDLNPDNLYYDYNYSVKIMDRDIRNYDEVINWQDIVLQYKSLIGLLFNNKYSFEDFYNGGIDLLNNNKSLKKYFSFNTVEEIKKELVSDLNKKIKDDSENYIEIKSRNFKIKDYLLKIVSGLFIVAFAYGIYSITYLNPFKDSIIKANNYYFNQDYEGVIKSLEDSKTSRLSKESKYMLAHSYIVSDNLSDTQKKNILLTVSSKSDENILDYWIFLGRSDYDEAIDLGKKIQDNELTLYALIKKDKFIQDDDKMSGEEKQKIQETLKSEIDKLSKELKGNESFKFNTNAKATEEQNNKTSNNTNILIPGAN
ncbi:type VII secretion protein EssB/YukC [Clostridium uliginosum]|uniref:Type VII secretion protein EssB n=1 Tax=Clostridium uliginosum TaxID=119641 RepID=A0A1I1PMX4_9CLOT|nr:type VII secretion protein EssB/YukC [Clostridium uliginosum]SFD11072.1 type VII secretion protein EssB [Clostridium uliginosum]